MSGVQSLPDFFMLHYIESVDRLKRSNDVDQQRAVVDVFEEVLIIPLEKHCILLLPFLCMTKLATLEACALWGVSSAAWSPMDSKWKRVRVKR